MPYRIRKNDDGSFAVLNAATGDVKAKHTTYKNAKAQVRLLKAEEHGWMPNNFGVRGRRRGVRRRRDGKA